jgi:hypothetical protein
MHLYVNIINVDKPVLTTTGDGLNLTDKNGDCGDGLCHWVYHIILVIHSLPTIVGSIITHY